MQWVERHGQVFDLVEALRQGVPVTGRVQAHGFDALQYGQVPVLPFAEMRGLTS